MGLYVDGYVVPVKKARLDEYKRLARKAGKVWIEYGALEVHETVAEDVKPGKWTSFPQAVKLKDDEVVIFSYIIFKSRKARDKINAQVMADPRLAAMMKPDAMPMDGKRMFWGGFDSLVKL
jgi:uncharacterized protein YbaA (DUF1428 family)